MRCMSCQRRQSRDELQADLVRLNPAWAEVDALQAPDGDAENMGGFILTVAIAAVPADGRLLLVGHEPDLSRVVGELTGARADVKKGGLAIVRLESAGGELVALLRPRELGLIADAAVQVAGAPLGGE